MMSTPNESEIERNSNLQINDGVNIVLDSVLEHIDGLLMDNIPPNPALTPLPPLPQSKIYNNNNNNETDYIIAQPQYHLQHLPAMNNVHNNHNMVTFNNNSNNSNVSTYNNLLSGYQQTMPHFFVNNNENKINQEIMAIHNQNNNISNNKTFMTPSSSYNSLVSLGSVNTANTANTTTNTANTSNNSVDKNTNTNTNTNNNLADDYKYNNNNILLIADRIKIVSFTQQYNQYHSSKLQLKDYVFISKDCTSRLSDYIVNEEWGKDCTLLYKYIDYIFRCQAFKKQIIVINNKYLIFHTALQRRTDKEFLYALLVPNKKYVTQKWRVQFGKIKNSFLSKTQLLSKLPQSYLINDYLPKRTKFYTSLSELLYDETYSIEVNWEERLTTNKDRIHRVLGNIAFFDSNTKFMKLTELIAAFEISLQKTKRIAELNPRLAVAQGFIDTKHCAFRLELLLPLIIEFPNYSSHFYIFALAMNKSQDNETKYVVKSILTMDMAYSNARLVGYVDSNWLFYGKNNNKRYDINDFFCKRQYN